LPSGSSIIYIGSTLSLKAIANMSAYATSKHALIGLMRSTCQDLAGQGIHTACVCPGFTDTEMLKSYSGDVVEQLKQRSTQGRLVAPQEIAEAVYFCATNSVVNGTVLQAESGLIEY
jgi:NAD(P)-dependent dehydrogenase (short-subunit alcohol dehydrogenase family)